MREEEEPLCPRRLNHQPPPPPPPPFVGNAGKREDGASNGMHIKSHISAQLKARKKLLAPEEELTKWELFFMIIIYGSLILYTFLIFLGELFLLPPNEYEWCTAAKNGYAGTKYYSNIDFNNNLCFMERTIWLLGLNQQECDFARRMVVSVFFGCYYWIGAQSIGQTSRNKNNGSSLPWLMLLFHVWPNRLSIFYDGMGCSTCSCSNTIWCWFLRCRFDMERIRGWWRRKG
mmetsp:Transcript_20558/g.30531  ORF Transcript_20558/g.30531 Transcript_20558/m.30531 type:complete len:231 (-) Transcript_20558:305-997(-)